MSEQKQHLKYQNLICDLNRWVNNNRIIERHFVKYDKYEVEVDISRDTIYIRVDPGRTLIDIKRKWDENPWGNVRLIYVSVSVYDDESYIDIPYDMFGFLKDSIVGFNENIEKGCYAESREFMNNITPKTLIIDSISTDVLPNLYDSDKIYITGENARIHFTQTTPKNKDITVEYAGTETELEKFVEFIKTINQTNNLVVHITYKCSDYSESQISDIIKKICRCKCVRKLYITITHYFGGIYDYQIIGDDKVLNFQSEHRLTELLVAETVLRNHKLADPRLCGYIQSFFKK